MNRLYFTIGLPRSGKSTWAKKWVRGEADIVNNKFTDGFTNSSDEIARFEEVKRIVVSPDAWRLALGHRYNWYAEPVVFSHVQVAIRALLQDYDVLVDDTNTSIESIKRILEIQTDANYVFVNTLLSVCMERAKQCGQDDLIPVMRRMDTNLTRLHNLDVFNNNFATLRSIVEKHSSRKVVVE